MSYLGLAPACVAVYRDLTHVEPDRADAASLAMLDRVADALAKVVPIYVQEEDGSRCELSPAEMIQGHFTDGGRVFVTRRGEELHPLSVARADLAAASALLAGAGIRFPAVPSARAGHGPRRRR